MIEDRFEIEEKVYDGAMATSYRAHDRKTGQRVLLKVLSGPARFDREIAMRFQREARIQSGLRHLNIVKVYDRGTGDDGYIAFEYIEGRTLRQILKPGIPLDLKTFHDIFKQVVEALRFAHHQGVVHRDLKPENILVDQQGTVKLTDFGLAFAKGQLEITEIGTVLGTPAYMSPEQARGKKVDDKSDYFSLGTIMYECLTGANPFRGESYADTISRLLSYEPGPLSAKRSDLDSDFARQVDAMLNRTPDLRPQRLETLKDLLEHLEKRRPKLNSAQRWLVAAGALAIVVGAGVRADLLRRKRPAANPGSYRTVPRADTTRTETVIGQKTPKSDPRRPRPAQPAADTVAFTVSVIPWANLYINGRFMGTTPLENPLRCLAGRAVLQLTNRFYPDVVDTIDIQPGCHFAYNFDRRFGSLEVLATPWAVVFVDGQFVDTTPITEPIMLTRGLHTIRCDHPEFGSKKYEVAIEPAEKQHLHVDFGRE